MEIRNITDFPTDYLDAYCDAEFGHTNWEFIVPDEPRDDISRVVVFWKEKERDTTTVEDSEYFRKENG